MRKKSTRTLASMLVLTLGMSPSLGLATFGNTFGNTSDWYILRAHGRAIGTVNVRSYHGPDGLVTEVENISRMTRKGAPFDAESHMRFVEAPDNFDPLGFSYRMSLGEQPVAEAEGEVEKNRLNTRQGGVPIKQQAFLFPAGRRIEDVYSQHADDPPGSSFTMQTLHLGVTPQLVETEVTVAGEEQINAGDGQTKTLRKFALQNILDNNSLVYEWRDDKGKLYRALTHDGTEMVYALQDRIPAYTPTDVIENSQISTNRIAFPRLTYTASYRLLPLPRAGAMDLKALVPTNRQQRIEKTGDENDIFVTVQRAKPINSQIEFPILYDRDFLSATPLVQSDDFAIVNLARSLAGKEKRAYFAALRMKDWVQKNIATKNFDVAFGSASQTLQSREGDCTEHAVLLAAMTRAVGIPSRVAVGLVYVPESGSTTIGHFVYHMWTEIYMGDLRSGEWYPLDPSFPEREMDATHIKLFDDPLASPAALERISDRVMQLMGGLRIDVLKALADGQSVISLSDKNTDGLMIPKIDIQRVDIRKMTSDNIRRFRVQPIDPELSLRRPEGLLSLAIQYLANDEYDKAMRAFQDVSAKIKDGPGHYKYARQLLGLELYGLARQEFQKAAAADPALAGQSQAWMQAYMPRQLLSPELEKLFMEGVNEEAGEKYAEALSIFNEVAQQAPGFSPVYLHIGYSQLEDNEPEEAFDAYQAYAGMAPQDPRGPEGMALAYMNQQQYGFAANAFKQAQMVAQGLNLPTAGKKAKTMAAGVLVAESYGALSTNKNNARAWLTLGKGLYQQDNYLEAAKAFANAVRLSPSLSEAKLWQFHMMLENGQWQELEPLYASVSGIGNPMARTLKGRYEMRTRQYDKAEATLKQAIAANPGNAENHSLLAQVYMRKGELSYHKSAKYSKAQYHGFAVETLRKGVGRVTDTEGKNTLRRELAMLLLDTDPTGADALASEVLSTTNTQHDPSAWTLKGQTALKAGNDAEAERYLKQALAANSFDEAALKALGDLYRGQGRISQALYHYQEAVAVNPDNVEVSNALRSLIEENKLSVKKPDYKKAFTADERDYLIQLLVQYMHLQNGNTDFYQSMAEIYTEDMGDMSVAANAMRPEITRMVNQYYDTMLKSYNALNRVVPPRRLIAFHQTFQELQYGLLEIAHLNAETLPILVVYESRERYERNNAELTRMMENNLQHNVNFFVHLGELGETYSLNDLQKISNEAGDIKAASEKMVHAQDTYYKKIISVMEKAKRKLGGT